jgi:hypothetical protein
MSVIKLVDFSKLLGLSVNSVILLKREIGLVKGSKLDTDMLQLFLDKKKELKMKKGGLKSPHIDHYKDSLDIINDKGFISCVNLSSIFELSHVEGALSYFDSQDNSLYGEKRLLPIWVQRKGKKGKWEMRMLTAYMLVNPVHKKMRHEALIWNGPKRVIFPGTVGV